jgi:hypothetical protein
MSVLNYNLETIELYSVDNKKLVINDLMVELNIYESILSPFMTASLVLADSGSNIIGSLPIQGNETVKIKISTQADPNAKYEYTFVVFSVNNRFSSGKIQMYELKLISEDGLANEALRIGKKLEGYGHEIVLDIMNNIIKTKKPIAADDNCKFKMKFIPANKRPFDLIYSMAPKCISSKVNPTAESGTGSAFASSASSAPSTASSTAGKLKGTAGYLFFETYDGYIFRSIDKLCSSGDDQFGGTAPKLTLEYAIAVDDKASSQSNALKILEYTFDNELDIMKRMRMGTYSSLIVFFNPSTGYYEEYVYSLSDTYSSMVHMGSADKLPKGQKELSQYPTRVMTQFVDHETFYNDTGTASPEAKDKGSKPTQFPDWKKFFMSQSIGRMSLMTNQVLNITIPCNLSLRAGDKIEALLPNMSSETGNDGRNTKKYDEEHSGVYLIQDICYNFQRLSGSKAVTSMKVVRDSYGMKDKPSKVK